MGKDMDGRRTFDLVALGECLIDVLSAPSNEERVHLTGTPGGAPLNVSCCAAGYGLNTAIITKLSTDALGEFLLSVMKEHGVCPDYIVRTGRYPTTLAMVSLDASGNRDFSFYRTNTSDVMLDESEVSYKAIRSSRMFHFGSVTMTCGPARSATFSAAECAKRAGCIVSYDPNVRLLLWEDSDKARTIILQGMKYADLVKVSAEELFFLTGCPAIPDGAAHLMGLHGTGLLAVTLGAAGSRLFTQSKELYAPAYSVDTVDTTGAGDVFWGSFLFSILRSGRQISELTEEELVRFLSFSNAAGALATTKKGVISALPSYREVLELIGKRDS